MKREKSFKKSKIILCTLPALAIATLSGCGSQNYSSLASASESQAPGSFNIAPKVDIILVEDDTGSMFEPYDTISSEVETFMGNLGQQNWNYHFGVVPMTTDRAFSQAVASNQDVNWGSLWTAPYPGATMAESQADSLNASIFTTLTPYPSLNFPIFDGFVQDSDLSNELEGGAPAFENLLTSFQNHIPGTGFLRKDAMTAVIYIGNKNDTSYVNMCYRSDNTVVPCEQVGGIAACSASNTPTQNYRGNPYNSSLKPAAWNAGNCMSASSSYNYYVQQFEQKSSNMKMYAAVAAQTTTSQSCDGGNASEGARFQSMANSFGGTYYDVCSQSLSTILSDIQANLTSTVLNYVTSYVLVSASAQPDPTTIQVQKYLGGDSSNAVTIPQICSGPASGTCDPYDGWSYAGYMTNQDTILSPMAFDPETGYMIELHGTAQLQGQDTAYITYKTVNGQSGSSSSN